MKKKIKKISSLVLRFGLSIGLLVFLFKKIDVHATAKVVQNADINYLFFAFASFVSIYLVLLWRWLSFIRALGLRTTAWEVTRFFFVGLFGNLFLPTAIGGDIIKTVGLCHNNAEKPKVVASVLLDRLSGFAGISLTALLVFPFASSLLADRTIILMIFGMAAGIIVMTVILFSEPIYAFFCRLFERLPRFKKALMRIHYDAALLKGQRRVIYQTVAMSCVAQILLAVTFWLIGEALQQKVDFVYYLIFVPIICVASSVPSIGGLGVREAGAAYLFAKVGMNPGVAVSISLMNFVFMTVVGALGGILFFMTKSPVQRQKTDIA